VANERRVLFLARPENGSPDVLRYEDVPDPVCPDGCVLLDVETISIEGGDLLARAASPPPASPHIVGYLCAGTVVGAGAWPVPEGAEYMRRSEIRGKRTHSGPSFSGCSRR
jgi:NADPH:quinone reductase-like Zn-dependent oxidoreductase